MLSLVLFISFFFGDFVYLLVVRVYHNFLYLRVHAVNSDCYEKRRKYDEREDNGKRKVRIYEEVLKQRKSQRSEEYHNVSLDAEDGEQKRVLEHLEQRQIERDEHEIYVVSHEEIQHCQTQACIKHYVCHGVYVVVEIEEYDVVYYKSRYHNIKYAVDESLLNIAADGVKEVVHHEHRLSAEHISPTRTSPNVTMTSAPIPMSILSAVVSIVTFP